MTLHRVLYCSRNRLVAADDFDAAMALILASSRANNSRDGITGGLIFNEGCFAQVLEGRRDTVEATFERIQCDERHGDVVVLRSERVAARDFADWAMAFDGGGGQVADRPSDALTASERGGADANLLLRMLRDVVNGERERLSRGLVAPASRRAGGDGARIDVPVVNAR